MADHTTDQMHDRGANGDRGGATVTKALLWVGIAGLGAALAFTVARTVLTRRPSDPTSQRIQELIDEANQLLKTLDEQRHSA